MYSAYSDLPIALHSRRRNNRPIVVLSRVKPHVLAPQPIKTVSEAQPVSRSLFEIEKSFSDADLNRNDCELAKSDPFSKSTGETTPYI